MFDETVFHGRRLAIVGSICRDVKIAAIDAGPHLLEDGETPTAGIVETIGGGAANSALAAASLGAHVRLGGKVGDDPLGQRLERALVRRGVTSLLHRDPNLATGSSVVLSYRNGRRHFVSCQPNNYSLALGDIDQEMLTDARHLLRADVWFSEPMLAGGNALLLQAARARGVATSLDINWDPYWGSADAATIAAQGFRATDLALGRHGPRQRPRAEQVCRRTGPGYGAAANHRLGCRRGGGPPGGRRGGICLPRSMDDRPRRARP